MKDKIKIIAFDGDDTLWENEPYFQQAEKEFCALLESFLPTKSISERLLKKEIENLPLYGYGIKGFVLCMIETAAQITHAEAGIDVVRQIIEIGKRLLQEPVILVDGIAETLTQLQRSYKLVLATKGDLLDQEIKLEKSGLQNYFHHIEIMSDKKVGDYAKLLKRTNCIPENFLMLGNSIKSDIIPVLQLGGYAAHVPFHITWAHEQVTDSLKDPKFLRLNVIADIFNYL